MLTYQELAHLPSHELDKQDIAVMNLACAEGLPKTEWLKPEVCLNQLDFYARTVEHNTAIEFKEFRNRPVAGVDSATNRRRFQSISLRQKRTDRLY